MIIMEIIKKLNYNNTFKIGSFIFNNLDNITMILQNINMEKTIMRNFIWNYNEIKECSYIYFYKVENILISKFIGMYIHKK